ncbi:polyprenyl synthetase family protein [Micromonospora sp. WMMD1120]|uniref:polyprenyl synthetase family protein n=1 Tax=Micromonospora sp. WMMD1120 TaxID=3016106 RepID=UPI002416A7FF|nr:polyprenyl synthetase family protein [Micromonospora sp. WMMD1120]MDG4809547.1 polyprenyl synthetase family protein [Micromonospora sp. WMMD1120]
MTIIATRPTSGTELQQTRQDLLDQVEQRLDRFTDAERARWRGINPRAAQPIAAIIDMVSRGGKRLRPIFCLSGFLASGGAPESPVVVDAAAALELLQAFALIQDDVIDNSALRRGAPTIHVQQADEHSARGWQGEARRFGEGVAVLAGDLALVYADQLTFDFAPPARRLWNEMRTELIIGQHLDVAVAAEAVVDARLSRWIAVCKSGRYSIQRPLVLGATLAGRLDLADAFEGYGLPLGEAFQLRDDLMDAFGTTATAGKPAGLDFAERKMTLLLALAVERDPRIRDLLGGDDPWDGDLIRSVLEETGVRATVERTIAELVDSAVTSIAAADLDNAWKDEFTRLATLVAYRDR